VSTTYDCSSDWEYSIYSLASAGLSDDGIDDNGETMGVACGGGGHPKQRGLARNADPAELVQLLAACSPTLIILTRAEKENSEGLSAVYTVYDEGFKENGALDGFAGLLDGPSRCLRVRDRHEIRSQCEMGLDGQWGSERGVRILNVTFHLSWLAGRVRAGIWEERLSWAAQTSTPTKTMTT
jgi:hypothetical protein